MYDMYHWHRIDAGTDDAARHTVSTATRNGTPRNGTAHDGAGQDGEARRAVAHLGTRAHRNTPTNGHTALHGANVVSPSSGPAVRAVQVALDRRDNGGDLAATCGE